jgi:Ca2+-transporting ATPase
MHYNFSIEYTRTVVFTTLILSNVFLTFVNRSFEETFAKTIRYKNSLVPFILVVSAIFLFLLHFVSPVQRLFQLASITGQHFLICAGVSLVCVAWFEVYKMNLKDISNKKYKM